VRTFEADTIDACHSEAGFPTVHAVSKLILIGTSHGLVLVFDHQEHLKAILGNNEHIEYGAVTAIDITPDGTMAATGHQNGFVILWDVTQATELKVLADIHKGSPVVHLRFLRNNAASTFTKATNSTPPILSVDLLGIVLNPLHTIAHMMQSLTCLPASVCLSVSVCSLSLSRSNRSGVSLESDKYAVVLQRQQLQIARRW
jgi:WD40 repeat protein